MKYIICSLLLLSAQIGFCQVTASQLLSLSPQHQSEEKQLQKYFAKNQVKPQRTESGIYYVIHAEGEGAAIRNGQTVSVMYTGKFLDGRTFDSNTGRAPLKVRAGRGDVIAGMDEPLLLMKKGTSATIYIPSELGYGEEARGPIPANSILIFDMEITDVK